MPDIEVFTVDAPDLATGALGAKGTGELPKVGVAPAIANAAFHATGKRMRKLPISVEDVLARGLAAPLEVPGHSLPDKAGRQAERTAASHVIGGHVRGYALLPRRTARTATTLLCLFLGGCSVLGNGFLAPAGPVAAATRHEFLYVCLVLLFVIAPVLLLAPLIAWHYRLSNTRSAYQPQWGFSWPLEGLIWIPPSLIIAGLSVLLWRDTHRLDPYKPLGSRPLEIEAVAMDWKWLFIYPEQNIAMVNRLVIQAGQPVHLRLTSATVMQSILMPRLAGQIYAMAGMCTQLNFAASAPGSFWGENTQFNGFGFQNQTFEVSALDAAGFANWLASTKAQPNRLDPAAYEVLSRRSILPHPLAFGAVDPGLFGRIVAMAQPGGHVLAVKNLPPAASPMETSQ